MSHAHADPQIIEPDRTLDPRVVSVWRTLAALIGLPLLACGVWLAVVAVQVGGGEGVTVGIAAAVLLASAFVLVVVWPRKRYACYGWTVRDEGVIIRRGWLWRDLIIVPHSRIQAVDAGAGPLLRRAGLAKVHIRTASSAGSPVIPGILEADAEYITQQVAARADAFDAT